MNLDATLPRHFSRSQSKTVDSADYTLAKKFWYPTEKGRTFCMDMHHIEVFNDEHVKIHFTFENVLADYAE